MLREPELFTLYHFTRIKFKLYNVSVNVSIQIFPTNLCDITVCEQQQGQWMDDRRVSDENNPTGFDSSEERQPATGKLFFSSGVQKKKKKFTCKLTCAPMQ